MKQLVPIVNEESVRCLRKDCETYGFYDSCYLHTYLLQDCFRNYYTGLTTEQKELLRHPERFNLTW